MKKGRTGSVRGDRARRGSRGSGPKASAPTDTHEQRDVRAHMLVRRANARAASRRLWPMGVRSRAWHDVASPGRLGDPAPAATLPAALRAYLQARHAKPVATATATVAATAALGDALAQFTTWSDVEARVSRLVGGGGTTEQQQQQQQQQSSQLRPHSPYRGGLQSEAARSAEPVLRSDVSVELGPQRTLRFAALAGALAGGAGELWFRRALLVSFPGWTYDVALRTAFELALFAPAVLAAVVGGTALLTPPYGDVVYARHKLREDCYHSLGKLWTLWGGGAAASYLLVPTPWQPPFAAALGVAWSYHVSRRVHLPTARRGFSVSHAPEEVGKYLQQEQQRAQR